MREKHVLVTGGAGYIGSHLCVELLQAGYAVTVLDNYSKGRPAALDRVERITGRRLSRVQADVRDRMAVEAVLRASSASAVLHLAGLKSLGESLRQPLDYYDNNMVGSLHLLQAMQACDVKTMVFSSSAMVYGQPQQLPITEAHPLSATNPYGRSKLQIEDMLRDVFAADGSWRLVLLRYFNPVGAHVSGLIGEDPTGEPSNLMPLIAQVALGHREFLDIWGDDYSTEDGTGVRDYIHVSDLAQGHVAALRMLQVAQSGLCTALNLGAGEGISVRKMISTFEAVSGRAIRCRVQGRRLHDVASCYADPSLARSSLGLAMPRSLQQMCEDGWRWYQGNPKGYEINSA